MRTAEPVKHLSDGAAKTSHSRFRSAATSSGQIHTVCVRRFLYVPLSASAALRAFLPVAFCCDPLRTVADYRAVRNLSRSVSFRRNCRSARRAGLNNPPHRCSWRAFRHRWGKGYEFVLIVWKLSPRSPIRRISRKSRCDM